MIKKHEKGRCPVCGSKDIVQHDFELFGDKIGCNNMTCNKCKTRYREEYELVFRQYCIDEILE